MENNSNLRKILRAGQRVFISYSFTVNFNCLWIIPQDFSSEDHASLSERREELATAALATLNNITFYREPPDPPDPLDDTLEHICKGTYLHYLYNLVTELADAHLPGVNPIKMQYLAYLPFCSICPFWF